MATRDEIPAAFFTFDDAIGDIRNNKVYPSEAFLRLMESLFLRTGGEVDQIKEVAETTDTVVEVAENLAEGQVALDEAVTAARDAAEAADAAAAAADEKAAEAKADAAAVAADVVAVDTAVTDLNTNVIPGINTRLDALENP